MMSLYHFMKYLFVITLLIFVLVPDVSIATTHDQGLVPCGGPGQDFCQACHFIDLGNTILSWLIGVLMVVFAMMIVAAGFGLVTSGGNPEAKSAAKSKIMNAIIGLVIVLGAWLIVDIIMRGLLVGGGGEIQNPAGIWSPWSTIECINLIRTDHSNFPTGN